MGDHFGTRSMYGQAFAVLDADSNGGADISIVAASTNGRIVVDTLHVSMSAAGSFFFESGTSTVIFPTTYLAANTSFTLDSGSLIRTAKNEALTFSATITGNVSVFVKYHIEPCSTA